MQTTTTLRPVGVTGFLSLLLLILLGTSCTDDVKISHTYTYLEPVYSTTSSIRDAFGVIEAQTISAPGKIYYLNGYIFLNEPGKGIHVINNADPSNPVNEAFINIPGNFDMAAKGNILYADSYIDLLAIDISNLNDVSVVKRLENVFPLRYDIIYMDTIPEEEIILTEYREVKEVQVYEEDLGDMVYPGVYLYNWGFLARTDALVNFSNLATTGGSESSQSGVGGSMARFTISGNHLYTVDYYNLTTFDIASIDNPVAGISQNIGWDIETIFPYQDKLFVGSRTGMYIFDASNPDQPVQLSQFEHARSCDPVIAEENIAYVTLRSGSINCDGFTNQLDVVNVSNLEDPILMKSFSMQNPHGLGKDGDLLFIAEGEYGLKVFNAADPLTIGDNLLVHYNNIHAFDVIPLGEILLVTGEDGLCQYDYSDPENIVLLSKISVNPSL